MCVLSIKVYIRKKSGNLSYAPHTYIYIYILKNKVIQRGEFNVKKKVGVMFQYS